MPGERWAGTDGELVAYVYEQSHRTLESYRAQPNLIAEHAALERDTAHGGYKGRQLFELVQNSADALWAGCGDQETVDRAPMRSAGRIEVCLTKSCLYCADDGAPIDEDGITALMFSRLSPKLGTDQIGTFGLGFKAVLGVSDSPEFFSRSGSFRFDRARARQLLSEVLPDAGSYPVLRLPEQIDPVECSRPDAVLSRLMKWAVNIVRLPLLRGARKNLSEQIAAFPVEFLLFVDHVRRLALTDDVGKTNRSLELERIEGDYLLADGDTINQWRLFERTHTLSSDARADRRHHDDRGKVKVSWAANLDRLDRPGKFWSFFPTKTTSLLSGILNAPWKTNEDRRNLLGGPYNDELIDAASALIADELPSLTTASDPARHLDALPRRHEAGDSEQADLLRGSLFATLQERAIVPDQDGRLQRVEELHYPPRELTGDLTASAECRERWGDCPNRPNNWLHDKALTRSRLAAIDRLHGLSHQSRGRATGVTRASISQWLEALVSHVPEGGEVASSAAAVQVAALIAPGTRTGIDLGRIVLTEGGGWRSPDPAKIFLPDQGPECASSMDPESRVHPDLTSDDGTLAALKRLGIKPPSTEGNFRLAAELALARRHDDSDSSLHERFWLSSRKLDSTSALSIIRKTGNWITKLRLRTRSGSWRPVHSVLMPDDSVPYDSSRDDDATVDTDFHRPDTALLTELGIASTPTAGRDQRTEPLFDDFLSQCQDQYLRRDDLQRSPQRRMLAFNTTRGVGPVTILSLLSDEGAAQYTDALLHMDTSYEPWTLSHTGTNSADYPKMKFNSLTIDTIGKHGRIHVHGGSEPFESALGPLPANPSALYALLRHRQADKIKSAFDLSDPVPEILGEREPIPLTDVWPGLRPHLPMRLHNSRIVACQQILVAGAQCGCLFQAPDVFLAVDIDDHERKALKQVVAALGLELPQHHISTVLQRSTPAEIKKHRAAVRERHTDPERLLAAVGEKALRAGLPQSLLEALDDAAEAVRGYDLAEAAIATHHTGALRYFKASLGPLDPPVQWAGSQRAVNFVRSLGFSEEWAGERNRRRPPFKEVEGPWPLPVLHDYQRTVATNVRKLLRCELGDGTDRRGMLSMPTGSGKTRVAVQAIVEAMRDDEFSGGVLWVADRDELCEQAVEAWSQVWRSLGPKKRPLRISRMWSGQPKPHHSSEFHVVVATVQTLRARLKNRPDEYAFLKEFKLAVFDEAHRSIAPTFTTVMAEIGLTYRTHADEPFLLGLTATPYRGRDQIETERLVRRYGQNRLDTGAFTSDDPREVIAELQNTGVLARADQAVIEGGTFCLTPEEIAEIAKFARGPEQTANPMAWLPQSVEDRVARDSRRTERIVEEYRNRVQPGWPTLIFATSVEHAQTLAALLNLGGTTARCVSGETETAVRRRVVDGFRSGEITVLVNYGVFREGFDAPKTRAIIVARPVYSPNLYFQMIGRGLRGPKNGGDDRCLILNVRDTIENFGQGLAFADLDWLWDR